uniref:Uncharacterized protein n=1 Tax=Avena sativa TaxID=4498 RepID=A0ACD6AE10_AVESA
MDSTLSCLLAPTVSPTRLRRNGGRISRPGCSSGSWRRRGAERKRRNGGGLRVKALFGDGGGDGFRAMMRIVKLNSAIQNRSVKELMELVIDECQYFFSHLPSVSVSQMSKNMFLLLHELMLRHHVSFVLKPAENGGFDLGVKWSLGLFRTLLGCNNVAATVLDQFIPKMFPCRMEGPEAAMGRRLHCVHHPRLHRPTAHQPSE